MTSGKSPVNGFINLYKPLGPTSMDMVRDIKRLTGQRKRVGHGGTLDPLADGVLPICFGQATRLMEHLVGTGKQYRMVVHLGAATSTYDGEGEVVRTGDPSGLDLKTVEEALKSFQGIVPQIPPMYSAIKIGGKRLYKLARSGIVVERQPRTVEISRLEILEFSLPTLTLNVDSGRGAYMRSLAHDLGEALGCGAYLKSLIRLRSGPFIVEEAVSTDRLQADGHPDLWKDHLLPVDFVLLDVKSVAVGRVGERYIRNGQPINLPAHIGARAGYMEKCRAYTEDGRFLAVMSFDKPSDQWRPHKVFILDTPSPYAPSSGGS